MAKSTLTVVEDDLDGKPGASTVTFGLNGRSYEIDLREKNRKLLAEVLAPYLQAGREITRGQSAHRGGASGLDHEQLQAVRAWATSQGIDIAERGRVAKSVIDAYYAAH